MKRLRFRFQRLLEIKERLEGVRQRALGEAMRAASLEQESLEGLQQTQFRYRQAAAVQPARALDVGLLRLNVSYDQRLQRESRTSMPGCAKPNSGPRKSASDWSPPAGNGGPTRF